MALPGETEAGSAGKQPCRGIARRAHRDDDHGRGSPLSRSSPNPIGSIDPDALKIPARRAASTLTRSARSPVPAEPAQLQHHPRRDARPRPGVADGGQQRVPQTVDLLGVVQQASKNVIPPGGFGAASIHARRPRRGAVGVAGSRPRPGGRGPPSGGAQTAAAVALGDSAPNTTRREADREHSDRWACRRCVGGAPACRAATSGHGRAARCGSGAYARHPRDESEWGPPS